MACKDIRYMIVILGFFWIVILFTGFGIGDQCSNRGVKRFTEQLSKLSKSEGYCMLKKFVTRWCISMATFGGSIVKKMKELSKGFNIVGLSQIFPE
ncbi:hypothetical protein ACSBR2_023082 [Camellia fascicularis]